MNEELRENVEYSLLKKKTDHKAFCKALSDFNLPQGFIAIKLQRCPVSMQKV